MRNAAGVRTQLKSTADWRNKTTAYKNLQGWLKPHDKILSTNKGAQWWTLSFTYTLVLWTQQSTWYQEWVHMSTEHWYCNCSSLTSSVTLGDPSPMDTRHQIPAVKVESLLWEIFMKDALLHYYNGCKGCWDGKSAAPRTVVLKYYIFYQDWWAVSWRHTCTVTICTSLLELIAFLPSERTHFQASLRKEDQITITLIFELAVWHGWQTIAYNESVCDWTVLYFCARLLLEFVVLCMTVKLLNVYRLILLLHIAMSIYEIDFVHHHEKDQGAFSWSFIINYNHS